jgi:osmotically inducible lipoprotein OsmB
MKILKVFMVLFIVMSLIGGCAGLTTREQRVLSGGAIGAGAGAVGSAIVGGNVAAGAAIGAAAGAVGGLIYDESKRRQK